MRKDNERKGNKRISQKYKIWGVIASVVLIAIVVLVIVLMKKDKEISADGDVQYKELQEVALPKDKTEDIPIDFIALQKENPDIYAWIRIPDTLVDYPILQSADDDTYYLTHTAINEEAAHGAIYTEKANHKDFTDPNTLIYGHNMENVERTMFGSLQDYADRAFFESHRDIVVYTPTQILNYKVFAAYETDDRHILLSYDFANQEVHQSYLDNILNNRDMGPVIINDLPLDTNSKIITLSTCVSVNLPERRYLVQAVLIP